MSKAKKELKVLWAKGYYSLGWRGWLANKLLNPVLNRIVAEQFTKSLP